MAKFVRRSLAAAGLGAGLLLAAAGSGAQTVATPMARAVDDDGVVKVRSAYPLDETITRIRKDIADKGIVFFLAVNQQALAAKADIALRPSTLLIFGNPPLGAQFLTANPFSGLDWPVRLLVLQDQNGAVWVAWTDFAWIARRHHIDNREQQFAMATSVVESITSTVRAR